MVISGKDSQHSVDSKKPVGMHSTYVVPYELVICYRHHNENKEIQSPHHLAKTEKRIVVSVIEIPKVA